MEVKYFTPYIEAGQWQMEIPVDQRTTGGTASRYRIFLPEGIHTVKIHWEGNIRYFLRHYLTPGATAYRELLDNSVNPATQKSIIREVVSPPGGSEIVLWCAKNPTQADVDASPVIHAGVTIFFGTNES